MNTHVESLTGKSGINADSYFTSEENQVYVIADGASGAKNKVLAGKICTDSVQEELKKLISLEPKLFNKTCIEKANNKLIVQSQMDQGLHFGTMMMNTIRDNVLYTSSIGDSVTYLIHENEIKKITHPRKRYSVLVELGILEESAIIEAISNLPPELWSVYDYFLPMIILDLFETQTQLHINDTLVMCTDGISDWISEKQIKEVVSEEKNAKVCVQKILDIVNQNCQEDKRDDQTIIIKKI